MGNAIAGAVTEQIVGNQVSNITNSLGLGDTPEEKPEKSTMSYEERKKLEEQDAKEKKKRADAQAERHRQNQEKSDAIRAKYGLDKDKKK